MKINWKQKLTSRKLWAAIAAVVITVITAIFENDIPADIVELIGKTFVVLCCYIFGESFVDVARTIWNKVASVDDDKTDAVAICESDDDYKNQL